LKPKEKSTTILQNLNDLISALSESERTTYNSIIHSLQLEPNAFEKYASWSKKSYTRNCIADTDKFELILICWNAGHQTSIHDHGGEECWVKVIEGEFKETVYKQVESGELILLKTKFSKENDITYMKDFMGYHRLESSANKRSMSLHLYAKPIRSCNVFNEASKTFVHTDLEYDSIS